MPNQEIIKPMLAIEYSKVKSLNLNRGYYVSAKYDGIRTIIIDGVAYSRSMKPIRNKKVQEWASKYREELQGMDGELISGDPTVDNVFRDTSSVVMSEDGGDNFTFYVFDNCLIDGVFQHRKASIVSNLFFNNSLPNVRIVYTTLVDNEHDLLALEQKYLVEGYEGVMLNDPFGHYKQGRSATKNPELIKKKLFVDSEFEVIGYEQLFTNQNEVKVNALGYTERSTCKENLVAVEKLGALKLVTLEGKEFNCGSGFDDKTRNELWNVRDNLIGKFAKIKYFDKGNYDTPRFPIFIGFRDLDDM